MIKVEVHNLERPFLFKIRKEHLWNRDVVMMICPARRGFEGCDENMILEVKVDAFSRHFRCFCFCCLTLLIYHPCLAKLHVNLSRTEDFHCLLILNLLNEFISKFLLVYKVLFDLAALLIYFMAKHPQV